MMVMVVTEAAMAIVPHRARNIRAGRIADYPAGNEADRAGDQGTRARAHHAIYYPAISVRGRGRENNSERQSSRRSNPSHVRTQVDCHQIMT